MNRLIIIGASGHGKVVADIAILNGYTDIVFLDDDENAKECAGYPVVGRSDAAPDGEVFVAVGNAETRKRLMEHYSGRSIPILIHPSAVVAKDVEIGAGSVVMAGTVINPGATIGRGVIVNTSSSVDHDCVVEDYVHVAVGAHLSGTVAAVNVRYKGQQFVIQALSSLKKKGRTNYEYHLVGGGDQSFLKGIAKEYDVVDQVIFHGSLKHDQVFKFLDDVDVYVQPSLQEGLPRALIEAMSRGLPCFGAHTGGIPELIEPEFVFSNGKRRNEEIQRIITSFTKEIMLVQAKKNFHEAEKYDAEVIDSRRRDMFEQFLRTVSSE